MLFLFDSVFLPQLPCWFWTADPHQVIPVLKAQMENKPQLIPLSMEQLRWEVHLSKCSPEQC